MKKTICGLSLWTLVSWGVQAANLSSLSAGVSVSITNPGASTVFRCLQSKRNSELGIGCDVDLTPSLGIGSGQSFAQAGWGNLGVSSTLTADGGPAFGQAPSAHGDAGVYFDEYLHISRAVGGINTAFSGSLTVGASMDGFAYVVGAHSGFGSADGNLQLTVSSTSHGSQNCLPVITTQSPGPVTCLLTVQFIPGDTVEIFMNMTAFTGLSIPPDLLEAHADFAHTARITSITIKDDSENPIGDAIILADSGTLYTPVASSITSSGATITWTTDVPADSQVEYGPTTSFGTQTTLDANLVTTHTVNLTGLTPNTLYHYRAKSINATSTLSTSPDFIFTTAVATALKKVTGQLTSE